MGKSISCFKLITCGSTEADGNGNYQASEIKDSSDKRGWSFRKKSARHRVLSNAVITDTPSSANKESSECTSINFQPSTETNIAEKRNTTNCPDEKPPPLSVASSQLSVASSQLSETVVTETESRVDVNPPESVVITIQAAIRGFMAQGALLKLKNVVKLQAAVRGHLVRRHAVGSLRCVQAIVKLQLLVRARHAQHLRQDKHGKINGSEILVSKSSMKSTSIEKLLSNRFAHQLLKSTPKNKPIRITCDPSKADSGWKWLERWMSVSSLDSAESKITSSLVEQSDNNESSPSPSQLETGLQSEVLCQSDDSRLAVEDSVVPSEVEEKVTTHDTGNLSFEETHSTSLAKDDLEEAQPDMTITFDAKVTLEEIDSQQNKIVTSDAIPPQELSSLPEKPEIDSEQPKRSMKRFASEQLETEGTKFGYGSRKASNPTFIAAQSKFEELSTMASSGRSSSLSNNDATVEAHEDPISVGTDSAFRSKELLLESSAPFPSKIGGSECGTELSISSTLDSPEISETGATENEPEAKDLSEGICNPDSVINHEVEANVFCTTLAGELPGSALGQPETANNEDVNGKSLHSAVVVDSKEPPALKCEKNMSELQREQVESAVQDLRASPEASPRSHVTVPESQGTPSSQVSVKPKERKPEKTGSGSTNRRRLLSAGNKSPANATPDSGSRGSREQLPKDQGNGKRRNSSGSAKPDHSDQESRDNSNNSSLPHFMQATESARAKINANNSPRSSPDLHDRDVHVKKRHSLPGASATDRQVSPRIQRSISQAQQGTKGQGLHPPHGILNPKEFSLVLFFISP
ncbi:protein IQ-DOMAIN 32 isoform X2 [Neltuma alba]|uniref:protein IQ-DOMAIN 32 isoform X2 n=1 Tax=Neltuma alba TaxID=207710 RepID=UPI0010A3D1C4|nr:protein IQ-DOMAIN 32 isoform X2 [Prosopis alba]